MKDYSKHIIQSGAPLSQALKQLDALGEYLTLFVVDAENKLLGTLTDGDIRRGLIGGIKLSDAVSGIMFTKFRFLERSNYDISTLDDFRKHKISLVPVLDEKHRILRIINFDQKRSALPVDVVIMAGGRGERLKPLTDNTPKPLLKVGNKAIIDYNVDRVASYSLGSLYITVRYLSDQLVTHFKNYVLDNGEAIRFVHETEPLGTIGSVGLIKDFSHDCVLVMNSDLLTDIDFEDFFRNFKDENADMSVASVPYHVVIPYAVLEKEDNRILSFKEKPTYTYYSNAGIYLIKKKLLDIIPIEKPFNATDFMEALIGKGMKVIQYPILGYWLDIGKHEDYKKAQEDIKRLNW